MNSYPSLIKENENIYKMSNIQESYLYGYLATKERSYTYLEFSLKTLNTFKLNQAWNKLIKTHPILNTKITLFSNQIETLNEETYNISVENFSQNFTHEILLKKRESIKNYHLSNKYFPLYEICVSKFLDLSIIHFIIDSTIVDGRSASLLFHQWFEIYENQMNFKNPSIKFEDYIKSIDTFKKKSLKYSNDLLYWQEKLSQIQDDNLFKENKLINQRVQFKYSFNKKSILNILKKLNISPSIFFLELLSQLILELNNSKKTAIVLTLDKRFHIVDDINDVVGPFTETMLHIINPRIAVHINDSFNICKNEVLNELDHSYCNSIEVLRSLKNKNINIRNVFTYRKENFTSTFLNYETYFYTQTAGIDLECIITDKNEDLFVIEFFSKLKILDIDPEIFFNKYIEKISKIININENNSLDVSDNASLKLNKLQLSYLSERFKGNYSGVIFKQFFFDNINLKEKLSSINNLILKYSKYCVDIKKQSFILNKTKNMVDIKYLKGLNQIMNSRNQLITNLEHNTSNHGLTCRIIYCQKGVILQVALDMVHFSAYRAFTFLTELNSMFSFNKISNNESLNIGYLNNFNINLNYYSKTLEFNLLPELTNMCDNFSTSLLSTIQVIIIHLFQKWNYLFDKDFITLINYDHSPNNYIPTDTSILTKKTLLNLELNIIDSIKLYENNNIDSPTTTPIKLVFTNCFDFNLNCTQEMFNYSYASTPNVGVDCIIYKKNTALLLEFNINTTLINKNLFSCVFDDIKFYLKEFSLNKERWTYKMNETNSLHKNILFNFINNNNNKLNFSLYKKTVYDWNNTQTPFDESFLIQDYFSLSVKNFPNNIAVSTNSSSLTYKELDEKSSAIANKINLIAKDEELIGVFLERNESMITILLAILKSGKAYLPLNISDPDERIETIIQESKIKTVILNSEISKKELFSKIKTYSYDHLLEKSTEFSVPSVSYSSTSLAYVIFTSGSTGKPKGVSITHKAVVNLIDWCINKFNFNHHDKVACVNPINFDLSVFDIFGILSVGGTIRIVSDDDRKNPYSIAKIIANENITFWNSAPAYLSMLLTILEVNNKINPTLRLVFISGDWIPLNMFNKVQNLFPNSMFVSLGGATEATIWSNYYIVDSLNPNWNSIPYGKPIQNSMYYILDKNLNPCKVGEKGNLYISGECLSLGYYRNPILTSEKFIKNPFNSKYTIMYNTGDLAKFYPDGNIEFLGRQDNQVKIRGHRIELEEIESLVKKHFKLNSIAFVYNNEILLCLESIEDTNNSNIYIDKLKTLLPEYMIPKKIKFLEVFPNTENGKIDRNKIKDLIIANNLDSNNKLLQNKVIDIKNIISEILNVKTIDFNDLGDSGLNSLQYTILSAKINELYGLEINPTIFFKITKINEINNYISKKLNTNLNKNNSNNFNEEKFIKIIAEVTNIEESSISLNTLISDLEINSLQTTILSSKLFKEYDVEINPMLFYKFKTLNELYLNIQKPLNITKEKPKFTSSPINELKNFNEIAIISMHYNFPCFQNNTFIDTILNGYNCAQSIPNDRFKSTKDSFVDKGNFIKNISKFDAKFFKISPREAELMDPRQRLLLEATWNLIEKSGYTIEKLRGKKIGVFIGATGDEYYNLCRNTDIPISELSLIGTSKTILANRISYYFDWHGPSEVIDTACSSSLVAIHKAKLAIMNNECEMAVVGGINLIIDMLPHIALDKVGMLSKDGKCKTFDKSADGYGRGEGYGLVLLKNNTEALNDNDTILATIVASSINHGGKSTSLTAPNPNAQSKLIYDALMTSNININNIRYFECHGTGTQLGDPIEIEGIKDGYSQYIKKNNISWKEKLYLGSVKANIGHLEAAAGIASLIKMIICMNENVIPKVANFESLNSKINLSDSNIEIPLNKIEWTDDLKYGAISSFGFGGVNSHVILKKSFSNAEYSNSLNEESIIPLSAPNITLLKLYAENLYEYLENHSQDVNLNDIAYTLTHRSAFNNRMCLIVDSVSELINKLKLFINDEVINNQIVGDISVDYEKVNNLDEIQVFNFKLQEICQLWCWGGKIDLKSLYNGNIILNLPTLPLDSQSYWYKNLNINNFNITKEKVLGLINIDKNNLLENHVIDNLSVVPGALYIEYLLKIINNNKNIEIKDLTWLKTINENDIPKKLKVTNCENTIKFYDDELEICSATYSFKNLNLNKVNLTNNFKFNKYKKEIYDIFESKGILYGDIFRKIEKAYISTDLAYAELNQYILDTSYIDAMFQLALLMNIDNAETIFLPFNINKMYIYDEIKKGCYILAKKINTPNRKIPKYDLLLLDKSGNIVIEIKNYFGMQIKKKNNLTILEHYTPTILNNFKKKNIQLFEFESTKNTNLIRLNEKQILTLMDDTRFKEFNLITYTYSEDPYKLINKIFTISKKAISKQIKLNVLLLKEENISINNCLISSISGFAKSLNKEDINLKIKILEINKVHNFDINFIYNSIFLDKYCFEFKYSENTLFKKSYLPYNGDFVNLNIRKGSHYILIGGNGKIGQIITKKILELGGIPIILSRNINKTSSEINAYHFDITNKDNVNNVLEIIKKNYSSISGIFNLAGQINDKMLIFKDFNDFKKIIDVKINGTINLLEAISNQKIKLDFLINFSSIVSIIGNIGQTDYSMSNRFLDNICLLNNKYIEKIRTINWPYWESGGMRIDKKTQNKIKNEIGQIPLNSDVAIDILFKMIPNKPGNEIISIGDNTKLLNLLNN